MGSHAAPPPRFEPTTRAQRKAARRQAQWAGFRAEMADSWRTEGRLAEARGRDHQAAVESGEIDRWTGMSGLAHMALTVVTGGLWIPVWIYVEVRNHRRWRRTSIGANDKLRGRDEKRAFRERSRQRSRDVRRAGR